MIRGIFKYLFPHGQAADKLPLLPRDYSSDQGADLNVDETDVRHVLGRAAARSDADARRLLIKHSGKSARHVAKVKRRERRRESRWRKAWRRFRELLK